MKETQTEAEIELQNCEREVDYRLRDLSANLLRLIRGGGKSYEVENQLKHAQNAIERYRATASHGVPPHLIDGALNLRLEAPDGVEENSEDRIWRDGQERMIRGALQIAASHLLGQNSQGAKGTDELYEGQRIIEELRLKNLKRDRI